MISNRYPPGHLDQRFRIPTLATPGGRGARGKAAEAAKRAGERAATRSLPLCGRRGAKPNTNG